MMMTVTNAVELSSDSSDYGSSHTSNCNGRVIVIMVVVRVITVLYMASLLKGLSPLPVFFISGLIGSQVGKIFR